MGKKRYQSRYSAEQIDKVVKEAILGDQLTQAEYDALKAAGRIEYGKLYRIYGDMRKQRLLAIYDGTTLVAKRDTSKRRGFPLTFPHYFRIINFQ